MKTGTLILAATFACGSAAWICERAMAQMGPGTCQPPFFDSYPGGLPAGNGPREAALGDLDGDLDLDVAVTNSVSNDVSILLSNGDGTYAAQTVVAVDDNPVGVVLADLDGDLDLDLAVANAVSDNVSVLLNNGDGTFAPHVVYGAGREIIAPGQWPERADHAGGRWLCATATSHQGACAMPVPI